MLTKWSKLDQIDQKETKLVIDQEMTKIVVDKKMTINGEALHEPGVLRESVAFLQTSKRYSNIIQIRGLGFLVTSLSYVLLH